MNLGWSGGCHQDKREKTGDEQMNARSFHGMPLEVVAGLRDLDPGNRRGTPGWLFVQVVLH